MRNATKYFFGEPCATHPSSPRYTSTKFCVQCRKEWNRKRKNEYRKENRAQINARRRARYQSRVEDRDRAAEEFALIKLAVVNVLTDGEGTCRWCGQGDIDVLCVDHVNDDGKEHRKEIGRTALYRWLIKNDYPPGFQILCYNCNMKKEVLRKRAARKSER